MAVKTNFFDGNSVAAADLIAPWAAMLADGVFGATDFAASAESPADLAVSVAIGRAVKDGHFIRSDAVEHVPIAANTSGYNRIDVIALQVDDVNKATTLTVVQGTPSSSPTVPILQSNQLPLAQVTVGNNVSVINDNVITDIRPLAITKPPTSAEAQSTDHQFVLPNGLKICWSDSELTYYANPNVCGLSVTMPLTYKTKPIVFATIVDGGTAVSSLSIGLSIDGLSTTAFQIWATSASSSFNPGLRPWVRWIAIGY